jgi:DsbC/DsbD-like thiol-disulfide interchange protein
MRRVPFPSSVPARRTVMLVIVLAWCVCTTTIGHAQLRTVKAEVAPTVAPGQEVRAGATVRVTLDVKLPEGLHVQSNKPRDASLIPTALTIDAPAGVRVDKVVYPAATDLAQPGQREPLAVFGDAFTITAHLTLAAETASRELIIPARLRYQACDEKMCYPPARVETRWTLGVK